MIDDFSNCPHCWTNLLSKWEKQVLLTPDSALNHHKWIIERKCGIPVIPASDSKLKMLVEILSSEKISKNREYLSQSKYPPTLRKYLDQWWLRYNLPHHISSTSSSDAKQNRFLNNLCLELQNYLGKDGYLLLCACAAYPELVGNLTFHLARYLIPRQKLERTLE